MSQEKLEVIIDTAKKMFARYGLRKTSIEEVARVARVAKATIYNHFGNKDQVYLEVLRREMHEMIKEVKELVFREESPEKKLIAFVKAKFRYMRKAINIINLDREGVINLYPKAESIRKELFEHEVQMIYEVLMEGVEKLIFHLKYPLLTANAIAHALRGFEINWLVHESEERIDEYLYELKNILFFGVMSKRREIGA
jgi:AcrR family transcriptional regulator